MRESDQSCEALDRPGLNMTEVLKLANCFAIQGNYDSTCTTTKCYMNPLLLLQSTIQLSQ